MIGAGHGLIFQELGLLVQVLGFRCWAFGIASLRVSQAKTQQLRPETRLYFRFPPSSAIYMISCLKMNRLGAPSRVRRTIFLS